MRRTKEEAARTRRDLLDAALTIFSRESYEAARLDDISQMADVTRGAIYHHFGSKAGLFMALIEDAESVGNALIDEAVAEGGTIADITARVLTNTMKLLEDDSRYRKVMALFLFETGHSPDLEDLWQKRIDNLPRLIEDISEYFRTGVAHGDLRPDLDPVTAARALLAFQNGLAMLWLVNPDAFSIKESASALADVFLRGVVAV